MNLRLELCWRLTPATYIDPRLFVLLRGVEEFGSLRGAAQQMKVSYRHAWAQVRQWSDAFGHPLIHMERGRGAKLSTLGHKLLWAERRLSARFAPELESAASEVNRELASMIKGEAPVRLRVVASHDLSLIALRQILGRTPSLRLDLEFRGSLESLKALHGKKCDLAGFHVPEGALRTRFFARYRAWLDPKTYRLIEVALRTQGWMSRDARVIAGDMPAALANTRLRFVNRQPGSGTRLAFDQLLQSAGLEPRAIRGYETEEFTHLAVAAMVAGDAADVGLGIHAAAAQFGLHFTSAFTERYVLAVRRDALHIPPMPEFLALLRGAEFQAQAADMAGYDAAGAGRVFEVAEIVDGALPGATRVLAP